MNLWTSRVFCVNSSTAKSEKANMTINLSNLSDSCEIHKLLQFSASGYERALSGYQRLPIDAVRVFVFIFEIWRTRCFRMFLLETALLLKHQIPHGHLHGSSLLLFLIAGIVLKDKTDIVAVFIRKTPFPGNHDVKRISPPFLP